MVLCDNPEPGVTPKDLLMEKKVGKKSLRTLPSCIDGTKNTPKSKSMRRSFLTSQTHIRRIEGNRSEQA